MNKTLSVLIYAAMLGLVLASPAEAARRKLYKPKPTVMAAYVPLFLGVGY